MDGIALVLVMAVTAEALVEYGKNIGKAIVAGKSKRRSPNCRRC